MRSPHRCSKQSYQTGLSLFHVNRQVHNEAASAFYKNNTFILCWNCPYSIHRNDWNEGYMMRALTSCILGLGGHAQLLRKLEVEARYLNLPGQVHGRLGPQEQDDQPRTADFGQLFPLIWRKSLALAVSIVGQSTHTMEPWVTRHDYDACNLPLMNEVLRSKCDDKLEFRKYWRVVAFMHGGYWRRVRWCRPLPVYQYNRGALFMSSACTRVWRAQRLLHRQRYLLQSRRRGGLPGDGKDSTHICDPGPSNPDPNRPIRDQL